MPLACGREQRRTGALKQAIVHCSLPFNHVHANLWRRYSAARHALPYGGDSTILNTAPTCLTAHVSASRVGASHRTMGLPLRHSTPIGGPLLTDSWGTAAAAPAVGGGGGVGGGMVVVVVGGGGGEQGNNRTNNVTRPPPCTEAALQTESLLPAQSASPLLHDKVTCSNVEHVPPAYTQHNTAHLRALQQHPQQTQHRQRRLAAQAAQAALRPCWEQVEQEQEQVEQVEKEGEGVHWYRLSGGEGQGRGVVAERGLAGAAGVRRTGGAVVVARVVAERGWAGLPGGGWWQRGAGWGCEGESERGRGGGGKGEGGGREGLGGDCEGRGRALKHASRANTARHSCSLDSGAWHQYAPCG